MSRRFLLRSLAAGLLSMWLTPVLAASGDGMIAIVAAGGHGKNLKKEELALIFKRKKQFWADGEKVQSVNLPVSNPLRRQFSQAVLGASPEELEKYWNDLYFHGISPPYVLSSEEAVLRFIAETPAAVGYASYCSAAGRANVVLVITATGHVVTDVGGIECER